MKRLVTLCAASALAFTANAQHVNHMGTHAGRIPASKTEMLRMNTDGHVGTSKIMAPRSNAKMTVATPFFTDTFSTTSFSTGGWVAGGNTPSAGTWKFTKRASNGAFATAAINSTSAAGGWMIYDSDSIGAIFNSAPQIGTLTSPTINCSAEPYVGVRFQQYIRRYQDTFILQVSNNGGLVW